MPLARASLTDLNRTSLPSRKIRPASGRWKPGEDFHKGALARAVVPHQTQYFAPAQFEVYVAERHDRAESLGDPFGP